MTVNKSRPPAKGKSSANPSNYSQLYKQSEQNAVQGKTPAAATVVQPATTQRTSAEVDWRTEYGYVFKDLRYLLLVSLGLFAAIVILGFFL
ncbi:MAG: hypothetical protein IAE81_15420 [Caldilineaceae bacterium]|jgi:hypothetical protein|nr:hypothetical protein [Caldilineaceae bacterium]